MVKKLDGGQRRDGTRPGPPGTAPLQGDSEAPGAGGEAGGRGPKLRRELRLVDGAAMIIGIIVGSGIFVSPKGVLLYAGSPGLSCLVWTLSGLLR